MHTGSFHSCTKTGDIVLSFIASFLDNWNQPYLTVVFCSSCTGFHDIISYTFYEDGEPGIRKGICGLNMFQSCGSRRRITGLIGRTAIRLLKTILQNPIVKVVSNPDQKISWPDLSITSIPFEPPVATLNNGTRLTWHTEKPASINSRCQNGH